MMRQLRWGILGTGNIAGQFCRGVGTSRRCEIIAIGSRSIQSAQAFSQTHGIHNAYGSYEAVLADPSVDAVYVSLPNSLHHHWTIAALKAGKHVLCEKPIAVSGSQAAEMFDTARGAGLLLVEAFMYRAHPLTQAVHKAVQEGAIGKVQLIRTSFCYRTNKFENNVRFKPELAGGAMMDIGCYCINFSRLFAAGEPMRVQATGHLHPSGVDDLAAGVLTFANGLTATFSCSMSTQADNTASINGTEGYIQVPVPWKPPSPESVYILARGTPPKMDGPAKTALPATQTIIVPVESDLYGLEADAFADAVLDGTPPWMTPEDSLGNMVVLDEIRRQIGLMKT